MLIDQYGRIAQKLRISVTDRCNFRCIYCMPINPKWLPRQDILTYEEILKLAGIFVDLGVRSIRLTGGEPLVRKDLEKLVEGLSRVKGLKEVTLTTNGFYLSERLESLISAGLKRINISLDTLRKERFEQIVRKGELSTVLDSIKRCSDYKLEETRLNTVVIKGYNDDEVIDLIKFAKNLNFEIRFIEFMPLEGDNFWSRDKVVTEREILDIIARNYQFVKSQSTTASPATTYVTEDGYSFGIIPSVSNPFCKSCDRIRLTSDGKFRTCLFSVEETDLKTPLRSGVSDSALIDLIKDSVSKKWEGHLINRPEFVKPARRMYQIGG